MLNVPAPASAYAMFKRGWDLSAPFLLTTDGRAWTYADLDRITAECSRRLRTAGLARGERLVSQLERSPWNLFLYLACMRSGVVYVPLAPQSTPAEMAPILADVEPALVVCAPHLLDTARSLLEGQAPRVLTLDTEGHGSFTAVEAGNFAPDADVEADDAAAIVYTSGTTGRPKGVVMPHGHFVAKAQATAQALGYRRGDRLLHTMPLYHSHGLFMTTHCVLSAGASMLLLPRFDAERAVEHLPQVTMFSGVATMYKRMLGIPALKENSRGIRTFIAASAALPADVFVQFEQQSGHRIVECWGLTETLTITTNPLHGERRPGSAGRALPSVEVRTLDPSGKVLPPGQPGVLAVRSATRFNGYWRRPQAEQARFDDGFFVTGDIGYFDADGYLTIVGRNSDMIISGGYNIYPKEVELALEQLQGVSRAAVFGLPHPDYGEAVAAAVQGETGCSLDSGDVLARLKLRLASYKAPKALFVVDSLPLTELGKIQRRVLAQRYNRHFLRPEGNDGMRT